MSNYIYNTEFLSYWLLYGLKLSYGLHYPSEVEIIKSIFLRTPINRGSVQLGSLQNRLGSLEV